MRDLRWTQHPEESCTCVQSLHCMCVCAIPRQPALIAPLAPHPTFPAAATPPRPPPPTGLSPPFLHPCLTAFLHAPPPSSHHEAVLVCAQDLQHRLTGSPEVALYATDLHGLDHHARETEGNLLDRGGGAGVGVEGVRQNRLVELLLGRRSLSNRPCDCERVYLKTVGHATAFWIDSHVLSLLICTGISASTPPTLSTTTFDVAPPLTHTHTVPFQGTCLCSCWPQSSHQSQCEAACH